MTPQKQTLIHTWRSIMLVVGSFMHIFSAIVVVVPIIAPLAAAFDVHPVHLGVIFLANLELGFLMPPAGVDLFPYASPSRPPPSPPAPPPAPPPPWRGPAAPRRRKDGGKGLVGNNHGWGSPPRGEPR